MPGRSDVFEGTRPVAQVEEEGSNRSPKMYQEPTEMQ